MKVKIGLVLFLRQLRRDDRCWNFNEYHKNIAPKSTETEKLTFFCYTNAFAFSLKSTIHSLTQMQTKKFLFCLFAN